jgi:hypothetical protein
MRDIISMPLLDLDIGWYLLADTALVAGFPEAVPEVATKIQGDPFTSLEATLRKHRLDWAIIQADAAAFLAHLPSVIDAVAIIRQLREWVETHSAYEWQRGDIPKSDHADGCFSNVCRGAVLAFRISAAVAGRPGASDHLRELLAGSPPFRTYADDPDIFPAGSLNPPGSRQVEVCAGLVGRMDLSPFELLECCMRIAMWLERSDHPTSVQRAFVRWAKAAWLRVAVEQRFRLVTPRISALSIESAAQADGEDIGRLAHVLEAGRLGVRAKLPPDWLAWLRTARGGGV